MYGAGVAIERPGLRSMPARKEERMAFGGRPAFFQISRRDPVAASSRTGLGRPADGALLLDDLAEHQAADVIVLPATGVTIGVNQDPGAERAHPWNPK